MYERITNKKKLKAFTLAEVLITLLIIGVVSSLIIPAIINDSQEAEFHTTFKKTYADINMITRRIVMDNAGSVIGTFSNAQTIRDMYLPYLNYSKVCTNSVNEGCWASSCKLLNGGTAVMGTSPGIVLSNGVVIMFTNLDANCGSTAYGGTLLKCGVIEFDVNGIKGPNVYGKDIYGTYLANNDLKPRGGTFDGYRCLGSTGIGCAFEYLYK
jgi:prepilin-type N-terminal cleavage/methylation domain-containing protein